MKVEYIVGILAVPFVNAHNVANVFVAVKCVTLILEYLL